MDKKILAVIAVIALIAVIAIAIAASGSSNDDNKDSPDTPSVIKTESVVLDSSNLSLKIGESAELKATVTPSNSMQAISWYSSDNTIVSVSNGKVTAMSVGTATITAQSGEAKATCVVTVSASASLSIYLDKTSVSMSIGESVTLMVTAYPPGSYNIDWYTPNPSVVTVSDGKVTALSTGTTTVIAQSGDAKATCVVTVTAPKASSILLDRTSVSLNVGDSTTISATVYPAEVQRDVFWSSSNASVAAVHNGIINAVSPGTVTVTASIDGKVASCKVTVSSGSTTGDIKALEKAKSYVSSLGISKASLKDFLIGDGFTESQATYAVDNCGADWNQEALQQAQSFMSSLNLPKSELEKYLLIAEFTETEAQYAVNIIYP